MKSATTKAIVLKTKNIGEKDKFVFLYSQDFGRILTVAMGARGITSKFTGHLETLNNITCDLYFGPKKTILRDVSSSTSATKERTSLEQVNCTLEIAHITEKNIFEGQTIKGLIPLINKTIRHIQESKKFNLIILAYQIKLLDLLGSIPDFKDKNLRAEEPLRKFFNYCQKHPYEHIEKIAITPKEENKFQQILSSLFLV